jgi:hypothetical protein
MQLYLLLSILEQVGFTWLGVYDTLVVGALQRWMSQHCAPSFFASFQARFPQPFLVTCVWPNADESNALDDINTCGASDCMQQNCFGDAQGAGRRELRPHSCPQHWWHWS